MVMLFTEPPALACSVQRCRRLRRLATGFDVPFGLARRSSLVGQAVPHVTYGLHHRLQAYRGQTCTQSLDVCVDRSLVNGGVIAPQFAANLGSAVHLLGVCHEEVQEAKFCRPHLDSGFTPTHGNFDLQPCGAECEGSQTDGFVRELRGPPPQHGLHTGDKFTWRKRFCHVVICTRFRGKKPRQIQTLCLRARGAVARGFTLIELLIVVALFGIMIVLAAPAMQEAILDMRIRSNASEIQMDLMLAKSEAAKRKGCWRAVSPRCGMPSRGGLNRA